MLSNAESGGQGSGQGNKQGGSPIDDRGPDPCGSSMASATSSPRSPSLSTVIHPPGKIPPPLKMRSAYAAD